MNRRTDTIRVATELAKRFSIYTADPRRLGNFARDLLATGEAFSLNLRESLERVAKW